MTDQPYQGHDPYQPQGPSQPYPHHPQHPQQHPPYQQAHGHPHPHAPQPQPGHPPQAQHSQHQQQPYQAQQPYPGQQAPQAPQPQQAYPPPAQPQAWPGGQGPAADRFFDEQHTQQWQGQTWETSVQPPVPAAAEETAYLPPQGPAGPVGASAPHAAHDGAGSYGGATPYGTPPPGPLPEPMPAASPAQPAGRASHTPAAPGLAGGYGGPPHPAAPTPGPAAAAPAAAPDADGQGPAYGPATLAGNSRVTDAQRARAEGRSPIIEPGMQPAALTAALGLLLAGGAALGTYALLLPLIALQGLTAAGWFRLNGMWPARQGIALGFLGALVADVALLASDRSPGALLGTLGVWVLLSLVLQLRSHADPDERMYGLTATVAAAALAILAGGYLAADADAVTVGAGAVAVATVVRALPLPTPASVAAAVAAAAGAGAALGGLSGPGAGAGALLGAGVAVCALIGHRVASYDYPSRFVHFTAGVALPLAAAAPAAYLLGRVIA